MATYFVGTNGSNTSPYDTPEKAALLPSTAVTAGDATAGPHTVYVEAGNYADGMIMTNANWANATIQGVSDLTTLVAASAGAVILDYGYPRKTLDTGCGTADSITINDITAVSRRGIVPETSGLDPDSTVVLRHPAGVSRVKGKSLASCLLGQSVLTCVILGDSRGVNAGNVATTHTETTIFENGQDIGHWAMNNPITAASAMLGATIIPTVNYSHSGYTAADLLNYGLASAAAAEQTDLAFIWEGVNSYASGMDAATRLTYIKQICQKFLDNGTTVILCTDASNGDNASGMSFSQNPARYANLLAGNETIRQYAAITQGVVLFDLHKHAIDPSSATNGIAQNNGFDIYVDAAHAGTEGALALGGALKTLLEDRMKIGTELFCPSSVAEYQKPSFQVFDGDVTVSAGTAWDGNSGCTQSYGLVQAPGNAYIYRNTGGQTGQDLTFNVRFLDAACRPTIYAACTSAGVGLAFVLNPETPAWEVYPTTAWGTLGTKITEFSAPAALVTDIDNMVLRIKEDPNSGTGHLYSLFNVSKGATIFEDYAYDHGGGYSLKTYRGFGNEGSNYGRFDNITFGRLSDAGNILGFNPTFPDSFVASSGMTGTAMLGNIPDGILARHEVRGVAGCENLTCSAVARADSVGNDWQIVADLSAGATPSFSIRDIVGLTGRVYAAFAEISYTPGTSYSAPVLKLTKETQDGYEAEARWGSYGDGGIYPEAITIYAMTPFVKITDEDTGEMFITFGINNAPTSKDADGGTTTYKIHKLQLLDVTEIYNRIKAPLYTKIRTVSGGGMGLGL